MKRIILVRHAKSSWKNADLSDFDRPLNDRGKGDLVTMGERLKEYGYLPDIILSSSARRASDTAIGMGQAIDYAKDKIEFTEELYMANEYDFYQLLHNSSDENETIMIVSHNPGITFFINHVSDAFIDNIPTLGVGIVEFDIAQWKDVAAGSGKLIKFDYPKNI